MLLKRFIFALLTVLLALGTILSAGCAAAVTEAPSRVVTDVTAKQAFTLIQENLKKPDFVLLDVRTAQEYAGGHVAGAINLDFYSPTFRDKLNGLDKNKTYLVYCRSGNRSQQTVNMMIELGFKKIDHMTGGIIEWEGAGLPTVKEGHSNLRRRYPVAQGLLSPLVINSQLSCLLSV